MPREAEDRQINRNGLFLDPAVTDAEAQRRQPEAPEDVSERFAQFKARQQQLREEREAQQRQIEENRRRAQERYDAAHTPQAHSVRFNQIVQAAPHNHLTHTPTNTALTGEFRSAFTNHKLSERKRAAKAANPKSRLFQKAENARQLTELVRKTRDAAFKDISNAVSRNGMLCDPQDLNDLSRFMCAGQSGNNLGLVQKFLGKSDKPGPGGREGQDVQAAMDQMASQLFGYDAGDFHLENDTALVGDAEKLERLSGQLAAFDRLAEKHHYLGTLTPEDRETLNSKLDELRPVAAYYQHRKGIITNEYYKTHYNDELSMDPDAPGADAQQKELANALLDSYVYAESMMQKSHIPAEQIAQLRSGLPQSEGARIQIGGRREELLGVGAHAAYLAQEYRKSDEAAAAIAAQTSPARKIREAEERAIHEATPEYRERMALQQKAFDTLLRYPGKPRTKQNYPDPPYTEEQFRQDIQALRDMDVNSIRIGSIRECVDNYEANYRIAMRMDELQYNISRGLINGFQISDDDLLTLRAKADVIDSAATLGNQVLMEVAKNPDRTDRQIMSAAQQRGFHAGFSKKKPTIDPTKDLAAQQETFRNKFLEEHQNREEAISQAYGLMNATLMTATVREEDPQTGKMKNVEYAVPVFPECPPDLMEQKKAEFQKNVFIADYMKHVQQELAGNGKYPDGEVIVSAHCKRSGEPLKQLPRTALNIISGRSADETIRLYNLAAGTNAQQVQFWCELGKLSCDTPLSTLHPGNQETWFNNFEGKAFRAQINENACDTAKTIRNLFDKQPGLKEQMPVPKEYESWEHMFEESDKHYALSTPYTAIYATFGQRSYGPGLGAFSVKDTITDFDAQQYKHFFNVDNALQDMVGRSKYRIGDKPAPGESQAFYDYKVQFNKLHDRLFDEDNGLFTDQFESVSDVCSRKPLACYGIDNGTLPEAQRERFTADMDHETAQAKFEKAYTEKAFIPRVRESLKEVELAVRKYDPATSPSPDPVLNAAYSSGKSRYLLGTANFVAYAHHMDSEQAHRYYYDLAIKTDSPPANTPEYKHLRAQRLEQAFAAVMDIDASNFKYEKLDDLMSTRFDKLMVHAEAASDLQVLTGDYENLLKDPEAGCRLTREQFNEYKVTYEALEAIVPVMKTYRKIRSNPEYAPIFDEMMAKSDEEIYTLMNEGYKDPMRANFAMSIRSLRTSMRELCAPGETFADIKEKSYQKLGVSKAGDTPETREAFRRISQELHESVLAEKPQQKVKLDAFAASVEALQKTVSDQLEALVATTEKGHKNSRTYNAVHDALKAIVDTPVSDMSVDKYTGMLDTLTTACTAYEAAHNGLFSGNSKMGKARIQLSQELRTLAAGQKQALGAAVFDHKQTIGEMRKDHETHLSMFEQDKRERDNAEHIRDLNARIARRIAEKNAQKAALAPDQPEPAREAPANEAEEFSLEQTRKDAQKSLRDEAAKTGSIPPKSKMKEALQIIAATHIATLLEQPGDPPMTAGRFRKIAAGVGADKAFTHMMNHNTAKELFQAATENNAVGIINKYGIASKAKSAPQQEPARQSVKPQRVRQAGNDMQKK